jgi:glycosyltransferase involved in cell wall biosynthesis
MSKVYFVGGAYMGCYYVRCFLPLLVNGWSGNYAGLKRELKSPEIVEAEMERADTIVFHRADTVGHHKTAILLKQMGKKIVFDNDDTFRLDENHSYYEADPENFKKNMREKNILTNNFIRNCDLVTCSTEFLAEEYREINPNVVVLPNTVDPDDWDEPLRNDGDKIRIGIVGSTAYYQDFDIIKDVIKKLDEDPRVQLVIFGLHTKKVRAEHPLVTEVHQREYDFWDSIKNIEHAPWVEMTEYFSSLNGLKLDMMLIPRRDNYFNKSKSNIKFLEASMCEIPVITNYFKGCPYENDLDGKNGIFVYDGDWMKEIEGLINDRDRRLEMGRIAHQYVLDNYNINNLGHLWEDAYNSIK